MTVITAYILHDCSTGCMSGRIVQGEISGGNVPEKWSGECPEEMSGEKISFIKLSIEIESERRENIMN